MKRFALVLLGLFACVAVFVVLTLPPRAQALVAPPGTPTVRGVMHVHTDRSDGSGTADEVAAAASRAGLRFVILTDHDTGADEPGKPYYRFGVLMIEGIEISTEQGHVIALGLPRAPYPLAGEARDVLEDIRRLGGISIAAHPESRKPELRWSEWTTALDGLEWLNGDSEWRDESTATLIGLLARYPFRQPETLARLLDRPEAVMRRWDELAQRRPVVAVAGADAHARIGLRSGEPDDTALGVHLPSYEAMFRTFSISVQPVTLSGDAIADGRAVVEAIRRGHVYSSIDALAAPATLTFNASAGRQPPALMGEWVGTLASEIEFVVETRAPENARIVLFKNGEALTAATGATLRHTVGGDRGVYRTEVQLPGAPGEPPVPWMVSNPIYVGINSTPPPAAERPAAARFTPQYENGPAPGWTVESSPRSKSAFDVTPGPGGTQLSLRWGLGGTLSEAPYVALVMPAGSALSASDRLQFTARADRPTRVSVQLRSPNAGEGERWHRSVYLDENARNVTVFFDDMHPRGPTAQERPNLATVNTVLFVIDTVNTSPGASGQIWIDDVRLGR
jgi:hypothetical protein